MTAPAQVQTSAIAGATSARWLLELVDRLTVAAPPLRFVRPGCGRAERRPDERRPGEMRPGEMRPGEMRPGELRSGEMRPGEMHSADTRSGRSAHPEPAPRPAEAPGPVTSLHPRPGPGEPDAEPHTEPGTEVDAAHAETWQLVRRAQDGDGEAFGQLYDRYFDVVFRFVYYRVNDRTLAEDFTSETFLRALRRITTISYQGRDIGAWFVTIARNIVFDHMKSARHRLETTTAETVEGPIVGADAAPGTEAAVLAALQSQRLMRAVAQLGDEQRECIVLRFVQGMSVSETAEIMGKKDGAIKAMQHRAIRKLAELIGPDPG